jgi:PAS domain S-box-containing protein
MTSCKEEETRYRLILESLPDEVYLLTNAGVVEYANETAAKRLGMAAAAVVGRSLDEILGDRDAGVVKSALRRVLNGGERVQEQIRFGDGATLAWVDMRMQPFRGAGGERAPVIAFLRDISSSKAMELLVREAEAQYRTLVENEPDAMVRLDRGGRHIFASANLKSLLGVDARKALNRTHKELGFDPAVCVVVEESLKSVFSEGAAADRTTEIGHGKAKRSLNWRFVPERDAYERVVSALVVIRDITVQRNAEAERDRLFSTSMDLLCVIGFDGLLKQINPAWTRTLGWTEGELLGRPWTEWAHPEDVHAIEDVMRRLIAGDSVREFENRFRTRDNDCKWLSWNTWPVPGEHRAYAVARDITQQKAAEIERQGLMNQLIQAQKMEAIGTLAGGIAHDFNNILGAIIGFAELTIQDAGLKDEVTQNAHEILRASARAKDLVSQILTFSRRSPEERKPVRLQLLVKETVRMLRGSLPATIEIKTRVDRDCGVVMGDPSRFHQVLVNLCTNAFQAMSEDGQVPGKSRRESVLDVSLDRVTLNAGDAGRYGVTPGPYVRLKVSDTGTGIEPAILGRIFEPYFTTKAQGEGTGLGLAVVRSIVTAAEGGILVFSEVGRGSCFEMVFPEVVRAGPDQEERSDEESAAGGTERVLLVDDEAPLLSALGRSLSRRGYRVATCKSGQEALAVMQATPEPFDVVLTDLTMPRMTGLELAREIRLRWPSARVALLSGFGQSISSQALSEAGVREMLLKPVKTKDVVELIGRVMGTHDG